MVAKIVVLNMVGSGAFWGVPIIGNIFTISITYELILREDLADYVDKQLILF